MNKRQAKKYLQRRPRQSFLRYTEREQEAWRKAKGRWSPWRTVGLKAQWSLPQTGEPFVTSSILDEICQAEDERILRQMEEYIQFLEAVNDQAQSP